MAYSSIVKPSVYFNTKLYTGTGSENAQTGVGFQPDWTWIKGRNVAYDNNVFDAVRGSTKRIITNSTNAETTANEMIKSFNSDGFTLGNDDGVNQNTKTYVAWNWKANGAGSANTDGSINSTVSVNTTAGFSIVSYTGDGGNYATIGHGLGVIPQMFIVKPLTTANDFTVYNKNIGNTHGLFLNNTDAKTDNVEYFYDTSPTNSVFTVGTNDRVNKASEPYIAYCFAEKKGYSKFGSYTGNGNADGPFIYTGFKPAFVMLKKTSGADNWTINDNKRVGYNVDNNELFPNLTNAEDTNDVLDLVSNGFKLRHTAGRHNTSGGTYIYMAFAEEPLVANSGTDGVPATAR